MSNLERIKLTIAVVMLALSVASVALSALQYSSTVEGKQESSMEVEADG